eukprot:TRINITY_DN17476_c0_g1_i1.p1 TRINITY_DN17476_c0_g1~~TRINITY_DN17476_c0_g1_i1.p1  ORF type:complete len:394 (-),score=65.87 TRINITY_DN17476_c0_g1_i1:44-1225(-)
MSDKQELWADNKCWDPFKGNNEANEIEDFDEFLSRIEGKEPSSVSLSGWYFSQVDLHLVKVEDWNKFDIKGALFMSCTFPPGVSSASVRKRGASVWDKIEGIPFECHRGFMYTQEELLPIDQEIFTHFRAHHDFLTVCAQSMHDFAMKDALEDYLEGKVPVGIMGGHAMSRSSVEYKTVVRLCRRLASIGFLIVTGGGPGAMEAANLGGYLVDKTDEEVEIALHIISQKNPEFEGPEYLDVQPAKEVLNRFGKPRPTHPSLGIPTFVYGWEPPNLFCYWIAKFFSNAIREDGLLRIACGGIVYFWGSAGTRQELFQAACHNHYSSERMTVPMILFGSNFWNEESKIAPVFRKCAQGTNYEKWILITDSVEEVVEHCLRNAVEKGYCLRNKKKK